MEWNLCWLLLKRNLCWLGEGKWKERSVEFFKIIFQCSFLSGHWLNATRGMGGFSLMFWVYFLLHPYFAHLSWKIMILIFNFSIISMLESFPKCRYYLLLVITSVDPFLEFCCCWICFFKVLRLHLCNYILYYCCILAIRYWSLILCFCWSASVGFYASDILFNVYSSTYSIYAVVFLFLLIFLKLFCQLVHMDVNRVIVL